MTPEQIKQKLEKFNNKKKTYYYGSGFYYTEGVKFLLETSNCTFLLDLISNKQQEDKFKHILFVIYDLQLNKDKTAVLEITVSERDLIEKQELTDIESPLDEVEVWCVRKTIQLPSEYWG